MILIVGATVSTYFAVIAQLRLRDYRGLADARLVGEYQDELNDLLVPELDRVPRLEAWLERADPLSERYEIHRRNLVRLRAQAERVDPDTLIRLKQIREETKQLELELRNVREGGVLTRAANASRLADFLEQRVALEKQGWSFAEHEQQWEHDALTDLVIALEEFNHPEPYVGAFARTREYLKFLRSVEDLTVTSPGVNKDWQKAAAMVASHPAYGGLKLPPQLGLVPIGPDPSSGLWEFAHLQSGTPATRDASGDLRIGEETGLVFVLLPAGSFRMGAERPRPGTQVGDANIDPDAGDDEGPVHDVQLAAFFISKYEMTQAQWLRWTGRNPSVGPTHRLAVGRHSLIHPVENVSWNDATTVLNQLGLELPTEAQWEYACRGGTATPWWTGQEIESIINAANVADLSSINAGAGWSHAEKWLDDGYAMHAPVNHYRPNPFGLHNVHGNVWEWCRENYGIYCQDGKERRGDGFRPGGDATLRVLRGGGFYFETLRARSTTRFRFSPEARYDSLGVRPIREVDP